MTTISVVPFPVANSIASVKIYLDNFELNALSGTATVYKYDTNDKLIDVIRVEIPSHIWSEWATDDFFIIDYILETVGLQRKPDLMFSL